MPIAQLRRGGWSVEADAAGGVGGLARWPCCGTSDLDERLTSQYLAQLEGGVYEHEAQTVTAARARGGEAGAKAGPLTAKGSRGSTAEESAKYYGRQDIVSFLADVPFAALPWAEYTVS